ncbi:zinc finger MYM-type protein 1-like [Gordionus sp. m RMFG-2023]|uniref:zinc finger MYM-type protein 1-like n=1 Tax=Gordionus sp. m RMFG-2023 TaxID=3053472 RepID=UPI0031FDFB08
MDIRLFNAEGENHAKKKKKSIQKGDMIPISSIIDKYRVKIAKENRGKIKLTIEAILYCGLQGLALHGHKDSGSLNFNNNDNEEKLIVEINSAPCFSILADETTDIVGIEQMSLCARYVDTHKNNIIKEMFLQFIPVSSMTGSALADLNINMIRGQGYDGALAMSGQFNGLQAFIKKKFPTAIYVYCAAHSLNLAISDSCSLPLISNCLGKISSIYEMFRYPKRQNILNKIISETPCPTRRKKLQKACPTRWSLRHQAVTAFIELEEPIIMLLQKYHNGLKEIFLQKQASYWIQYLYQIFFSH